MPSNDVSMKYIVDIVFCFDATGSMSPLIKMVKKNALTLYDDIGRALAEKRKMIDTMRLRVVAFRDYAYDGEDAMIATDFFTLPGDADLFERCVNNIPAFGGGDVPEDGLEALALAIRSDWTPQEPGKKYRQIIVVWTDAPTHEMGTHAGSPHYEADMPASFAELSQWWGEGQGGPGCMEPKSKRLLLFAPDAPYWSQISDNWNQVTHFTSEAGEGCGDRDYEQILQLIAGSV